MGRLTAVHTDLGRTAMQIYRTETRKPVAQFVADLDRAAAQKGFLIHNEANMDMARTFARHGQEVGEEFDLHMVQICKPAKAAPSLQKNPERSVLMPKFVMAFSRNGITCVRLLHFSPETVASLVGDDPEFPASLAESFRAIQGLIEEAL